MKMVMPIGLQAGVTVQSQGPNGAIGTVKQDLEYCISQTLKTAAQPHLSGCAESELLLLDPHFQPAMQAPV